MQTSCSIYYVTDLKKTRNDKMHCVALKIIDDKQDKL